MEKINKFLEEKIKIELPSELFEAFECIVPKGIQVETNDVHDDLWSLLKEVYKYAYKKGGQDQYDKMVGK
jgi:hypothetical protein